MLKSKESDLFQLILFQFHKMKINAHKLVNLHAYPHNIFFRWLYLQNRKNRMEKKIPEKSTEDTS